MSEIIDVIKQLDNLLALKPATEEDIRNIEAELSLKLADEYKEYISTFGAVLADGVELTGFSKSKNRDVVHVTQQEWVANNRIKHSLYVVENVGIEGLIIWQDAFGSIYESRPNHEAYKIADSLAEYLLSLSKK